MKKMGVAERRETLREAQRRILDEAARQRRNKKMLEMLHQDNHMEEPHTDIKATKRPKFVEDPDPNDFSVNKGKKRKKNTTIKARMRLTVDVLLEEEYQNWRNGSMPMSGRTGSGSVPLSRSVGNYFTAKLPPSKLPARKFCNVCGYHGIYACSTCGLRYCTVKCLAIHKDTRCMKWVV